MTKFCICTLTHDTEGRAEALQATVDNFLESTNISELKWFIVVNRSNEAIDRVLEYLPKKYPAITWHIVKNEVNTGPGPGINQLNKLSSDYEYSLFLEGDWTALPESISGHSKSWLEDSVNFLENNKDIDHIQFRRYLDDLDDRQYGYSHWIKPSNVLGESQQGNTIFIHLTEREYSNNPALRRMSSLYSKGIFPLLEVYDKDGSPLEIKGKAEWGIAENLAAGKKSLKGAWIKFGNFVHYEDWKFKHNWNRWHEGEFGCNQIETEPKSRCKYGFLTPGHYFCGVCEKDKNYTDLERHSNLYVQRVLPLEHSYADDQTILEEIKQIVENPTIDAETYINSEKYKGPGYIRNF